jgi:outer membrane protein insertion porin family
MAPSKGYLVSQGLTYTGGFLFGSRHYNRSDTTLEGYLTLLDIPVTDVWNFQLVLAAHSRFSILMPQFALTTPAGGGEPVWGWTDPVTDPTDLIAIDGMSVARGWGLSYGQALWDNKLELRMPIAKDVLWAVTFLDYAALWRTPAEIPTINLDQFLGTMGLGLRFTITQFPIRLYLGKKFQIQDGQWLWRNGDLGDPNGFNFNFIVSFGGDLF